jgi:branched-chain amino acid transport system substrate-binding protein
MKRYSWIPAILAFALFMPVTGLKAQQQYNKYGNVPDMLFPYDKYQKAYKYHFVEPMKFYGPGREIPEPKGLKEVRVGFMGPLSGSNLMPYGKQMLNGAQMAMDEYNSKGGYKGIPFKMMIHNDVGLWGAAANEVVKMDDEKVWAWLGSIDDIVSHVAIRATLKLEIPMVCTGDPDPTFTETNIPWVVRVISDDRQASYALSNYIFHKDNHKRVAVIRANNRYGRVGILHFNHSATHFGFPVIIEERFNDGETNFEEQLKRIQKTNPDAIVMWGNPTESALILNQIRSMGMNQPVYASDRIVNPEFIKIAGKNADGIIGTCQYNPNSTDPKYTTFKANYIKKFGMEPDVFAVHAYDGMTIILQAIQKAGLNRALIRDVLTDMKTFQGYEGAAGKIIFDATWNDIGQIYMSRVTNGKFEFFPTLPLERTNRSQEGTNVSKDKSSKVEKYSGY